MILCSTPSTTCPCWSRRRVPWTRPLPLQGWDLPEEFGTLRRLLESRMGRRGKREFVQVLRLFEHFPPGEVHAAVRDAIRLGALSFDSVKHLVLCRLEGRPPRLDLELYPYLPQGEGQHHVYTRLYDSPRREGGMNSRSTLLLEHHLKELKLPSFFREYGKMAAQCAAEGVDHPGYLLRLAELELIDRHQRMVERRIRAARFPAVKTFDTFDFTAIPSVNKALVMEFGPLRIRPKPGERHRRRQKRHRQDPHRPGTGPGRLPERDVRGLHDGRRPGPRVDGGPG